MFYEYIRRHVGAVFLAPTYHMIKLRERRSREAIRDISWGQKMTPTSL